MKRLYYQEIRHQLESEHDYFINGTPITGIVYDLYDNKQLKYEYTFLKAVLEGTYQSFYENGQIKEIGNYENGKKVGMWSTYFDNGKNRKQTYYIYGVIASYKTWNEVGKLIEIYQSNLEQDGISTKIEIKSWHPNGNLKAKIHAEYGIILSKKEWDIDSLLILDYKFTTLNIDSLYI